MPFSEIRDSEVGVVILGHGSRAPDAQELLAWVQQRLAAQLDCRVASASLQFNQPTLEECCRELAGQGVRRILVAPYFLYEGNHFKQDIPEELDGLRAELPQVEFILTATLGADDRLVDVLADRVRTHVSGVSPEQAEGSEPAAAGESGPLSRAGSGEPGGQAMAQHPIEARSFAIIDGLLQPADPRAPEYQIARRVVHASGDPELAGRMLFSPGAVEEGLAALALKSNIICDVNMVASGVTPTARRQGLKVVCGVAGEATSELAEREGITRGAAAMRLAARQGALDGSIAVVGNAPTALLELLRLAREESVRPALIVGVPVGFVDAAESKQALAESGLTFITLPGNRGGSSVAVAIVNALLRLGAERG